jgi:hypothetical protein
LSFIPGTTNEKMNFSGTAAGFPRRKQQIRDDDQHGNLIQECEPMLPSTKKLILLGLTTSILGVIGLGQLPPAADRPAPLQFGDQARYLAHLSTDKPIYRVGENLYARGVLLHAHEHKPLPGNKQVRAHIQVKGPKGDIVSQSHATSRDSVLGFRWTIPDDLPGGEYTLKVNFPRAGFPPAQRKFDIRSYRVPRLKTRIVFLRKGYGPGDEVQATMHAERADGSPPHGASVTVIARVDGEEIFKANTTLNDQGNCRTNFSLPEKIQRGEGTLAMVIEDGSHVETAAKTIPILLKTVDVKVFPEGGELVDGLPTRVYLQARTPSDKPADIAGIVVNQSGDRVARFRTEHEGRGRFAFTPRTGDTYFLKITEPGDITATCTLPPVKTKGAVIRAAADCTEAGQPVNLKVGSTHQQKLTVTLSKREKEVAALNVKTLPGELVDIHFTPPTWADGVLIATVWNEQGRPLGERLIYRHPREKVQIKIRTDKEQYAPGEKVSLIVKTTNNRGEPIPATVGLTVTDDSVLEMIDKREQAPRLPVMVLLEPEVRELGDAHVYLDPNNPQASLAVDLLLGTQGWRRFALVDLKDFLKRYDDDAWRALAFRRPQPPLPRPLLARNFGREAGAVQPPVADKARIDLREKIEAEPERADRVADEEMGIEPIWAGQQRAPRPPMQHDARLVPVRVYAHSTTGKTSPEQRSDFTETVYWNAHLQTDETGTADIEFILSDSVTTFRALADGFTADGALGQGTGLIESVEPFYIEPTLPLEVTMGDIIKLPIGVVNNTEQTWQDVQLKISAPGGITVTPPAPIALKPGQRTRVFARLEIGQVDETAEIAIEAQAGEHRDRVVRPLKVAPKGFPIELALGGRIDSDGKVTHTIDLPDELVRGSIRTSAIVYPTPLANMTQALQSLVREPHGCFEQTSSTLYPLVMAYQYFDSHAVADASLLKRGEQMLAKGYNKLIGFECDEKGYEWFGKDPGHEALTAYGLMEFKDLAEVYPVDRQMIERTRRWLLNRRNEQGGFDMNEKALDSFGRAPRDITNAYIVWALLQAGQHDLDKQAEAVFQNARTGSDSYLIALAANIAQKMNRDEAASTFMRRLADRQTKEGYVDGALTSITRSGGQALKIETTSLAVLAWLNEPVYTGAAEKAVRYLFSNCRNGRFGSTQSTILALRAILAYEQSWSRSKAPGDIQLIVDGKTVGEPIHFDDKTNGTIELPNFAKHLQAGRHEIALQMQDGTEMPYSLTVRYNTIKPNTAESCPLMMEMHLAEAELVEGAATEARVSMENITDQAQPMTVAIVGLPGGLEPRHDQLKELVKQELIAAYEVIDREVVLYWRAMKPNQRIELSLSLIAAVPGEYDAPAGRAYLYYTDENKHWITGSSVRIVPRRPAQ